MNEQLKRIMNWMQGKKPGPYSLEFYTDEGCNLNCKFCNPDKKKIIGLNFKVAFKIIDEAKGMGVKIVRIIGVGDPFIKPNLMLKLMEVVKKYDIYGYTVTNGTLFNEKHIEKLVEIDWDEIRISLHAPDAKTQDYLSGIKGSFNKIVENISYFNEWKKKLKKDKPKIRINFVLNKKNYDKIEDMIKLCEKLNCDFVLLPLEVPDIEHHKFLKYLILNDNDKKSFEEVIQKVKKSYKNSKIELLIPFAEGRVVVDKIPKNEEKLISEFRSISYQDKKGTNRESENRRKYNDYRNAMCFDPWLNITVKDFNNFGVCCPSVSFGTHMNIKKKGKYTSLKEMWYGSYFTKMRKDSLYRKMSGFCSFCCNTDTSWISNELKKKKAID